MGASGDLKRTTQQNASNSFWTIHFKREVNLANSTILVGNGPNRVRKDVNSWDEVLQRIAGFSGLEEVYLEREGKPFTVLFEEMAIQAALKGKPETKLKAEVAREIHKLTPNWVHTSLIERAGTHILTTNYDYAIEHAIGGCIGDSSGLPSESRYSLFRCREIRDRRVWHLHGEAEHPETITLGYEQYVGHLHKARSYLTQTSTKAKSSAHDHRSPFLHQEYSFEQSEGGIYSWVDIFLRDDIHIVGFSFEYSEIDFWWLLGMKERLRQNDKRVAKGVRVGRTFYYDFEKPYVSRTKRAHLAALKNFGAEIVSIAVDNKYTGAWEKLFSKLTAYCKT